MRQSENGEMTKDAAKILGKCGVSIFREYDALLPTERAMPLLEDIYNSILSANMKWAHCVFTLLKGFPPVAWEGEAEAAPTYFAV